MMNRNYDYTFLTFFFTFKHKQLMRKRMNLLVNPINHSIPISLEFHLRVFKEFCK